MDVENSEFLQFVAAGDQHQLEYMLVGGLALLLNGAVRFTSDADLWLRPTNANKEKLIATLVELGYTQDELEGIEQTDFTQPQVIRIPEGPIDVMTRVHFRFDYDDCRSRARMFVTKGGHKVYFIHINDLREIKLLARRPKDMSDVLMIDEVLKEQKNTDQDSSDQF